jgi:hypothetical protein
VDEGRQAAKTNTKAKRKAMEARIFIAGMLYRAWFAKAD